MSITNLQYPPTTNGQLYSVSASGPPTYSISGASYTGGYNTPFYQPVNSVNTVTSVTSIPQSLTVNGDGTFNGKLRVNGKDIGELLDKIEERLAILHPNVELEDKWKDLKALGDQYRELEKEIIEKEKMWEILNR